MTASATQFEPWTATGDAFDALSSRAKRPGARGRVQSAPFAITEPTLAFRIAGGDFEFVTCLNLQVDGEVVRSETGRATVEPHDAAFDLRPFVGRQAVVELVDEADDGWIEVDSLRFRDDALPSPAPLYGEALRPLVHFTARQWAMRRTAPVERQEGWLNDINGLVRIGDEFHLFAQRWNKCWIHAVSPDLVHWEEREPAFFEEALETGVQSGSVVVDHGDSSRLGDGSVPPVLAFWSRNDNRSQCVSVSRDLGRTWSHLPENPLLDLPERDPMVFRDHARAQWGMVLYGDERYHFLRSDDLLRWTPTGGVVDGSFECPDFFELPIDGTDETRWVLVRGDGRYSVGTFDGIGFTEEAEQLQIDGGGESFYATQSWALGPEPAARRVQVAWMRGSRFPGMPFSQQVSLPCELTLCRTPKGIRLLRAPIAALEALEADEQRFPSAVLATGEELRPGTAWEAYRVRVGVEPAAGAGLAVIVSGVRIDVRGATISCLGRTQATLASVRSLDVIVDRGSIEVFANGGEGSLTIHTFPGQPDVLVRAEGGTIAFTALRIARLRSVWTPQESGRP